MAVLKKWEALFNRTDLTTTDTFQIVGLDLSNADPTQQNQRAPITQLLRSGKNLSDLTNLPNARSNLGLGTSNVPQFFGATMNASTSRFNIVGPNPACNISDSGVSSGSGNFGFSSAGGQYFNNSVTADVNLRNSDNTKSIRIGVGSTGNSQLDVNLTTITANVDISAVGNISCAGTISGFNGNFAGGSVTATTLNGTLVTSAVGANRMAYSDATNHVIGSANYTVNGTGALTITGNFAANGGNFFAGVSSFVVSGSSNAAVNIGPVGANDFNLGRATSNGSFFNNSLNGDACIRAASSANLRLGAGSLSSQLDMNTSFITARVGILVPTSGGTQTQIAYNEETTLSTTLSGAVSVGAQTINITRKDNLVLLTLPAWTGTAGASAVQVNDTALATRHRPSADVYLRYSGTNNATEGEMLIRVGSNGVITWFGGQASTSTYTNAQTASAKRTSLVYSIV